MLEGRRKAKNDMDREILFRAKRVSNGMWVEGDLTRCILIGEAHICSIEDNLSITTHRVDSQTICQYTGLTDKNGRKIFEGDICKYYNTEDKDGIAVIREDYAEWRSGTIRQKEILTPLFYLKSSEEWEIIGNIFDNPELLEGDIE